MAYDVMWNIYFDCHPVSESTEALYSDDQFAHSYSNPYKLYQWFIPTYWWKWKVTQFKPATAQHE